MKILLYTDNHFCQTSSILRSNGDKYSIRLENQINSLNWVNKLAVEKNCELMIHLGDFFDRSDLNAQEISALKEIEWNNIPKQFLLGNHELYQDYNSLNILANLGEIIDQPKLVQNTNYEILYLPYILEEKRKSIKEYLKDFNVNSSNRNRIILSHNDIAGIRYGSFYSTNGFDIKDINDNCCLFINGHLHNQTQVNEKILNLGNLTGQNFNEDCLKHSHSIAILDTETLKLDLINNPYAINFIKIDSSLNYDFNKIQESIDKLENGVLSLKIPQTKTSEVRNYLNNCKNIIEYRLITTLENNSSNELIKSINKLDHIQLFKDYIINKLGNSDIIIQELNLL